MKPNAIVVRKLQALQYPLISTFEISRDQTKQLVYWLESSVIRHFPVEFRDHLKPEKQDWPKYFQQLLTELNCPIQWIEQPYSDSNEIETINWLLSKGIALEYEDNREFFNKKTDALLQASQSTVDDTTDYESAEFKQAVTSLANFVGVVVHPDPKQTLKATLRVIQRRYQKPETPVTNNNNNSNNNNNNNNNNNTTTTTTRGITSIPVSADLSEFPTGFDTGDALLNKAATVLRLLYNNDLRNLQTVVNEMVNQLQKYTADPKTDSSLGKNGR